MLGFSISAKPINELLDPLEDEIDYKIIDLNPEEQKGQEIKIAVVIREVRNILTKKNNSEMAFVKAEDTTGSIDMVIFPKLYQDVKNLLLDGKVVVVTGKVDQREDEISFLVEKMVEHKFDPSHQVTIPAGTKQEKLLKLKELFDKNAGDDLVSLYFEVDQRKILAKQKVKWSGGLEIEIGGILN